MTTQHTIRKACRGLLGLSAAQSGNVMVTFALAIIPVMGAVGGAVDYSRASSAKAAMQAALDSASLGTIQAASTQTPGQIQSAALALFNASFNQADASNVAVTTSYDAATNTVTVNGSASIKSDFVSLIGISEMTVSGASTATMAGKKWQICVLVTEPTAKHTLKVEDGAKIDFDNCMVQVNTANWDAVEARGSGYIHSKNGENCFVGDIHYGDVQPPKNPTCTFFQDPFVGYKLPASAGTCNFTNKVVNLPGTVLTPGTYCGGINITADTTFSKGLNPGSIVAGYILPEDGAVLNLTGQMPSSTYALEAMQKTGSSGPRLIN
jgi:Flp pilus assembly protein TadG